MKIKHSDLNDLGFYQLASLEHMNMIPFIKEANKHQNIYSLSYKIINGLLLALIAGFLGFNFANDTGLIGSALSPFFLGFAVAFLLLPLHEFIHGLAYKWVGAENTSYDVDWKHLVFMALAHQFVADKKDFTIVALAPFITISSFLMILILILPPYWGYLFFGTLFTHSLFCSGDFGMLSFFESHPDKEIVTYDDIETKTSHFYAKDLTD